jgi:hypothetical protein
MRRGRGGNGEDHERNPGKCYLHPWVQGPPTRSKCRFAHNTRLPPTLDAW